VTPPAEFPFAVFYFTGCDTFNVAVRAHAQTRGFTLNEHGLTHVTSGLEVKGVKTEKDIFSLLKLQWREPSDRTGPEKVTAV
jgi:DNA polymerase/3'-5' exonuclease PolX